MKREKARKRRWLLPVVMLAVAALVSVVLGLVLFLCSMSGLRLSDYIVF